MFIATFVGRAAHLVGGEITYRCVGNNNYEITLTIYRDCQGQGAGFDQDAAIAIYDANGTLHQNLSVPFNGSSTLPVIAPNNCSSLPQNVCTEKAVYTTTINLPAVSGGYTITYQRCCRNATISNIPNPDTWGNTYTTSIPSMDNCNTAPSFNTDPPVVLCLNQFVNLDLSANESDGDSLYYELCGLLTGGGQSGQGNPGSPNSPRPNPATPPPYSSIPFSSPFTINNPIPSFNPTFSINSKTGALSGRPITVGQFVFAICVSEFRNGVKLSTVRRDFQFNVSGACQIIESIIKPQAPLGSGAAQCSGKSFQFENQSINSNSFLWDFGDPNSASDTSTLKDPTYTYSDTGTYRVMLVADPGSSCADTSYSLFKIFDPIQASFTSLGDICFPTHSIDFTPLGTFSASATFEWNFGGLTNLGLTSTLTEPKNVIWQLPGKYYVEVSIKDFACESKFGDTITVFPSPQINSSVKPLRQCIPVLVDFKDNSSAGTPLFHWWDFGDGNFSTESNPTHSYDSPGTFTVSHSIFTRSGCQDSLFQKFDDVIVALPVPKAGFTTEPEVTDIYNPNFQILSFSEGHISSELFLPNGSVLRNVDEAYLTLSDTGSFEVKQVVINENGCTDTLIKTIKVEPLLNFFIPDAFTPNGDGINEVFLMSITAITSYNIQIYSRWGELIFQSNDLNIGWDGINANTGKPAPEGGYTYKVQVRTIKNRRDIQKYGTVKLIR